MSEKQQQILIKIVSIGNSKVGKSCLIKRFCEGRFIEKYIDTIGVDYGVKKMTILNKKVSINFFDLSGKSEYETISDEFIADAQGILLVFDMGDKDSFKNLTKWEKKMNDNGIDFKSVAVTLVANKMDLKDKVTCYNYNYNFISTLRLKSYY